VRRREFAIGLLLAAGVPSSRAQEAAKQHRIAIIIPSGAVSSISDKGTRAWQAFFAELARLGDLEGQNLTIDRYSGEGRPESYAEVARQVVNGKPDVIVGANDAVGKAVRAETDTTSIVWIGGDPIQAGFAASLAHPGGNVTGVTVFAGTEIWGKRLQILKEAVPAAAKAAYLTTRVSLAAEGQQLSEAGRRLQISVIELALDEVTATAIEQAFTEIVQQQSDAFLVNSNSLLFPYRQLIVGLAEKSRLPALYPWREYVEAGGLMAYASDNHELWRRMADDVHEILSGAKPGDIPIYQPTKFELVINLKTAKALDLNIPPALLAIADEVIE
jgi:putative tryptophan/tyrosine transport system substrate-binding protein